MKDSFQRNIWYWKLDTTERGKWMNTIWRIDPNFLAMASHTPDYYLREYGSDQVPLSLGALQLEPADRAVLKIAGNLNELCFLYDLLTFDITPVLRRKMHVHRISHEQYTWQTQYKIYDYL